MSRGAFDDSLPRRFERVARANADRIAVETGGERATYREIHRAANGLARAIVGAGGGAGDRVALLVSRPSLVPAAMLGASRAGRTVVPLSPADPPARLERVVADADPATLLADGDRLDLARHLAGDSRRVVDCSDLPGADEGPPDVDPAPSDLAFLLYTSGTTGRPKGVMLDHRGVLQNVHRHTTALEVAPGDRVLLLAGPAGGQGLATTLGTLLGGATLCPFPAAERGVTGLAEWIEARGITICVSSVSIFRHLAAGLGPGRRVSGVRLVRFASEPAEARDLIAVREHFPEDCVLLVSYSATETGNIARRRFGPGDTPGPGRLPVGREAPGIEVSILDGEGREVGEGETGEIAVRSRYLSPGYWRDEERTAARLAIADDGTRTWRTGDLGRRAPDGDLLVLGRRDSQVKIRGQRVELAEVETALAGLPAVGEAVVEARPGPAGTEELVAWIVPSGAGTPDEAALRRALRAGLPDPMVPGRFVLLDRLPLTPNGKVDRPALPAPSGARAKLRHRDRPKETVERSLARIWSSVLGIHPIGRHEDFFDLGGSSLQSARVLAEIEEALGASLPPSTLAEHGTIAELAELVAGHVVLPSPSPRVTLRRSEEGRPLFLVHSGQGDVAGYGLLVRRLSPRPVHGLQSPGLQGEAWPLMTVPAMARRYLREIRSVDPDGPYLLGGTCMGGMVAWEMARALAADGKEVALLALLDVPRPIPTRRRRDERARWYGPIRDVARDAGRIARWRLLRALGRGRSGRSLRAWRRFVAHMNARANRRYRPPPRRGGITLFIAGDASPAELDRRLAMRELAEESRVVRVPGVRRELFRPPAVDVLARELDQAIAFAVGETGP